MKALTVRQPWAWAIVHAGKDVENRTWRPPPAIIGQRIIIHAGKEIDQTAPPYGGEQALVVRGAFLGTVTVADAHLASTCHGLCSVWATVPTREVGCWHWELADPYAWPNPVPGRGALGLFDAPESAHG